MSVPPPEEREDAVTAALRDLSASAARSNLARTVVVAEALRAAEAGDLSEPQRLAALAAAHQVAGSAGTFGLPQASLLAAQLEESLTVLSVPRPASVTPDLHDARRRLEELTALLTGPVPHQGEE